jgi:glycerate dehydrogenase
MPLNVHYYLNKLILCEKQNRKNMKIVVLDGYTVNPGDMSWDELKTLGEVTIYDKTSPDKVTERAKGAEIILSNKVVIGEAEMSQLPDLKYIGVLATGVNNIDVAAAKARGIVVTNIPAYSTPSVGQMVFAHILNICQQVKLHSDEVHRGRWTNSDTFCFWDTPLIELHDKKIGLVGLGQTGYNTARIAMGFGMNIFAYTSKSKLQLPHEIKKMELDELFAECDVVSLHCPLTETTRDIVNARRLALMKPTAILINTGRGPLINEQDLADALNSGKILAAGLDVLSSEPPRADNPLLTARNCYITPHIAWATRAARERLMELLVENIKAFRAGKPVNVQ